MCSPINQEVVYCSLKDSTHPSPLINMQFECERYFSYTAFAVFASVSCVFVKMINFMKDLFL